MEIKRMYVKEDKRGKGIASIILRELEKWCIELKYEKSILETGLAQPEAIRLYTKNNYQRIPNYGQYEHVQTSVCFEKNLI
jgi:GNAT superfamily N-acetyltransferase